MAKTRMNMSDREAIRDAIVSHKFDRLVSSAWEEAA